MGRRPREVTAALRLLEHHEARPVDVLALAASEGVRVKRKSLDPGSVILGAAVRKDSKAVIGYNDLFFEDPFRRTVAVLLGWLLLTKLGNRAVMYWPGSIDKNHDIQRRCHRFADELLMPTEALREWYCPIHATGDFLAPHDVARLAEEWRVSPYALVSRLVDIGLVERDYARRWL